MNGPVVPDGFAGGEPPAPVDQQTLAEAAIGRALLMVQRMEEDARRRADTEIHNARAEARRDAEALIEQATARANEVAELTRRAVAQVLAEEHAELLTGLAELTALEQRLRTRVQGTSARVDAVMRDPHDAAPPAADVANVPTAPTMPTVPTVPTPSVPLVVPVSPGPEAPPEAAVDWDSPVLGPDDAFFADLRTAVGTSSIAGRGAEAVPGPPPVPPPVPPVPPTPAAPAQSAPDQRAAMATAAVAATTAAALATPGGAPTSSPMMGSGGGIGTAVATAPMPMAPPSMFDATPVAPFLHVVPPDSRGVADPTSVPIPVPVTPSLEEAPTSRRARASARRSRWAMVGTGLRNLGILLLLFVAFQLWGTSALQGRDQAKLRSQFQLAIATQTAPSNIADDGSDPSTVTTPTTAVAPPAAPSGEAVAVIKIPRIGLEQAVVEGTSVSDLRKGPGHYRNTPMPGQPGNAAVAGHRTTYGAPFNRLDELAPGDPILVTTLQGDFKYVVSEAPVAVSPSKNDVLFNKGDNRLTLTTCHPKYSAAKRLIVVAKLSPRDEPAAAPKVKPKTPATGTKAAADASTSGDAGALLPVLFWAALVLGAYLATVWLSRRWVRRAAFVVGIPVVLALLFPLFEQLSRLLPANY